MDLKKMLDEEFCVVVAPPISRIAMQVTVVESGSVLLSGKLAEQFAKKPVEIRFNKDGTAIQISCSSNKECTNSIVFPKNGRKAIPHAKDILTQQKVTFPAIFTSYDTPENGKWRGARQENPTTKPSPTSRSTKKK